MPCLKVTFCALANRTLLDLSSDPMLVPKSPAKTQIHTAFWNAPKVIRRHKGLGWVTSSTKVCCCGGNAGTGIEVVHCEVSLLGDCSLVTRLQPSPHPQSVALSKPRRLHGWLCSSGFCCRLTSTTQPNYQPQFLSLNLVQTPRVVKLLVPDIKSLYCYKMLPVSEPHAHISKMGSAIC